MSNEEQFAKASRNIDDAIELLRSRFHTLANDISSIRLDTSVIRDRQTSMLTQVSDHEARLRVLESEKDQLAGAASYRRWMVGVFGVLVVSTIAQVLVHVLRVP